ncbi:hypothetical protein I4U23_016925 [Adineta vaga]|nr:hypothetical protein I4U23_016925 [Adineta vaga]
MSTTNSEDLFICGKCHINFTDLNTFLTHRSTCVNEQPINICPISSCPLTALLSADLETFVDDISSDLSSTFVEQVDINNETIDHSSNENTISEIECLICDQQFESQTILENHIYEHAIYIRKDENINSKSIHNESLECKQCSLTFSSKASLNIHNKTFHDHDLVFRCLNQTCSQIFENPIDYIRHAQIHSQKSSRNLRLRRIYRCKTCKKLFPTSEQLQYHIQYETHKFLCQLCSIEFESKNSYHNHLAKHSDLPLYHCTICRKSFKKRADLSQHMITEHNENISKEKICLICNLIFSTRFHLNRHNITKHSNIKPFKCKEYGCEETFARKDKLKQHEAKHHALGGIYKCDDCSKTFVRHEHLRDHYIVKHSHQYPFSCEYCEKGFIYSNQLYDHFKQYHTYVNQTTRDGLIYNPNQFNNDQTDSFSEL